eukprot:gene3057-3607_t
MAGGEARGRGRWPKCPWIGRKSMDIHGGGSEWTGLLLYRSVRAFCDRGWDYFLPVYIAAATAKNESAVSTTALLLAVRALAGLVLTPVMARAWHPSRLPAFMVIENLGLLCSGLSLWNLWGGDDHTVERIWLACAGCAMSVEQAASKTQTTAAEKCAVVSATAGGTGDAVALSRANARLVQVDLAFAAASPFLVSLLTTTMLRDTRQAVPFLIALQLCLAACALPLALRVMSRGSADHRTPARPATALAATTTTGRSPKLVVLATGFLYFSVVSPGTLFLAFLKNQAMEPYNVAGFASVGQIAGIAGSLAVPAVVNRFGLSGASLRLLGFQAVAVAGVAVAACHGGSSMVSTMCVLTIISRLGLWGVDLTLRQLLQTRTSECTRVAMFGLQEGWIQ